jgi:hypothetical protein
MEELYNNNFALLVNEISTIIEDLGNNEKIYKEFDKTYFWENGSSERILSEINNIIKTEE